MSVTADGRILTIAADQHMRAVEQSSDNYVADAAHPGDMPRVGAEHRALRVAPNDALVWTDTDENGRITGQIARKQPPDGVWHAVSQEVRGNAGEQHRTSIRTEDRLRRYIVSGHGSGSIDADEMIR